MGFPFYKQRDVMDCGPACLYMIVKHYGREISPLYLKEQTFITRKGVSLLSISKVAEQIGFRTNAGRFMVKRLVEKALLPCILHWDQNHFVVLYKIKKKKKDTIFYIADPGRGLLQYNLSEFLRHWISSKAYGEEVGIALLLEPTHLFYTEKGELDIEKKRINFLWKYFVQYKRFFGQLVLGLILGSILQLIFPFLTQAIVDTGINGKDIGFIWLVLIAELMLLFSRTLIDFIRNKILLYISNRINISLISDFFIKLMKLPMFFFDTKLMGDLLQRIEDHRRVEQFLTSSTLNFLFSFFTFVIFGIVLFIYNIPIFFVFLTGSILYGLWIVIFLKKRKLLDYKYFEQQGKNRNITYQLLTGMQEIKLQRCEQRRRWEWEDVQADLFDTNLQTLNLQQKQQAGSLLINELKNVLITVMAATSVINGQLTLGMMLAIQYIIGQLNSPVEQLINFIYKWQDVNISINRMSEIHSEQNEENENRTITSFGDSDKTICLKNICFKYDKARASYTLKNINLTIPQGKVTAIVGESGSGKTTLIKLLLGYYQPDEGEIRVGSENLDKFNLSWWRSNCGAVMQEGFLFSDTIARNIAVSDDRPDLDRIRYAANMANISSYIEALPLGYNTLIGADGEGVSQGQRQRILIARIIYNNSQFVFLDEATNALDASTEKAIVNNLATFYKDKTVLVVAHRLSTVKDADQVIVLNRGEIVEMGSHEELTIKKGKYFQLVKNQLELAK